MDKKASDRAMPPRFTTSSNALCEVRITKLLIYAIRQYKQHNVSLDALTNLSEMILTSKNMTIRTSLKKILEEIKSLNLVENILTDILDELTQKNK